ncbi:MAG: hypothetical protein IJV11_03595, partial [Muribaculaceae bacterium]|nr:hypothetical protein [Muribaculaceae bacterium]
MKRNKRTRFLGLVALLLAVATSLVTQAAAQQGTFDRLDSLIAAQPDIVAAKEARLAQMKADLRQGTSLMERYAVNRRLYEEYSAYQYDSAYAYVTQCMSLARAMDNASLLNESRLNLAHILSTACLIDKAGLTLSQIDTTRLTVDQLILYHRTRTDLLIYQAEYMQGTRYAAEAVQNLVAQRQAIISIDVPRDNLNYLLTQAECEADAGRYRPAIALLDGLSKNYRSGERIYSIITSMMSFYCAQMGDKQGQMDYLVKSAESDLEGCIRENTSLRTIADRLFDEGDIDRAYRYMRVAVDDANFYGTRLRNIQASHIVPKILDAYQTKQERNHRNMMWLLTV